jgi:hypothetical protein
MNIIKKITMFAILNIASQALFAENKQQIILSNNYGQDIASNLVWQNKSFPYDYRYQDLFFKKNAQEIMHKSPISGYKLISIDTTPCSNVLGKEGMSSAADATAKAFGYVSFIPGSEAITTPLSWAGSAVMAITALGYEISQSFNHHLLKTGKDNYFVIEKSNRNSKKAGQKQIYSKKYSSKAHYENEREKTMPAELLEATPTDITEVAQVETVQAAMDNQTVQNLENVDLAVAA